MLNFLDFIVTFCLTFKNKVTYLLLFKLFIGYYILLCLIHIINIGCVCRHLKIFFKFKTFIRITKYFLSLVINCFIITYIK